eukprot:4874799-Pyramimonas_sp.AAC.1
MPRWISSGGADGLPEPSSPPAGGRGQQDGPNAQISQGSEINNFTSLVIESGDDIFSLSSD